MAEIKTAKRQTLEFMAQEAYARFAKKEDVKEYSLVKKQTADEGYFASYNLTKGGEVVGDTINIPKDYLVKSATIAECTKADTPVVGYAVGDKYLDFVVNTTDDTGNESHIYIKVQELVDVYTNGNGIEVGADNSIAVKIDAANANGLSVGADGVALALATETSAGAMSAEDKKKMASVLTESDLVDFTQEEITAIFDAAAGTTTE